MKKILKKLTISIILVIIMVSNTSILVTSNRVLAVEGEVKVSNASEENDFLDGLTNGLLTGLDGLVGIMLAGYRIGAYTIITIVRGLTALITALGGGEPVWSIEGIIFTGAEGFNGTEIVSVNFFDTSGNETVNTIRQNVAIWYYALRNLAIVISLGILLYVGIRIAISTVAEDEAKYKKMLKDWVISLALIFLLHYIMIFTIELNNTFVTILYQAANSGGVEGNVTVFDNAINAIALSAFDLRFTVGVANLIVYGILVGVTIIYLFMYIKRMLSVGFLIVISPLITITYSIDKMGDGKSQALNTWLKEFIYNVLIQTFHCIIYIVFVNVAIGLMKEATLASSILAVLMILFMHQAEEIIKNIFNFNSKSLASAIGSTAILATGLSFIKKQGDKAAKKGVDSGKVPNMNPGANLPGGTPGTSGGQNSRNQSNNAQNNMNNVSPEANTTGQNVQGQDVNMQDTQGDTQDKKGIGEKIKNWAKPNPERFVNHMIQGATLGMGMIGASTGGYKGAVSGYYAAKSVREGFGAKLEQINADKKVKHNEQVFAGGYNNFKAAKAAKGENWTDAQIAAYTQQLLRGGVDEKDMSAEEADYYTNYVLPMKTSYEATGEKDVSSRFQNTIRMINNREITPIYSNTNGAPLPNGVPTPTNGATTPTNGATTPTSGAPIPPDGNQSGGTA